MPRKPLKFKLGQRVRFRAYMYRSKMSMRAVWKRGRYEGEGIIVGKRTCTDGRIEYDSEEGYSYHATKHHSFWLVAPNLSGCVYVAEDDLEAMGDE